MLANIRYQQIFFCYESVTSVTICAVLNLPKNTYYYHADLSGKRAQKDEDTAMSKEITLIFKESRNNYSTRKIKKELAKLPKPMLISRCRIGPLMKELGLVSK